MSFETRTSTWKLQAFKECTTKDDALQLISLYCFSEWEQDEALDWFEENTDLFNVSLKKCTIKDSEAQ